MRDASTTCQAMRRDTHIHVQTYIRCKVSSPLKGEKGRERKVPFLTRSQVYNTFLLTGEKNTGIVPLNHLANLGLPFSYTEIGCFPPPFSAQPRQTGLRFVPELPVL